LSNTKRQSRITKSKAYARIWRAEFPQKSNVDLGISWFAARFDCLQSMRLAPHFAQSVPTRLKPPLTV
jgi:hypothetical protein